MAFCSDVPIQIIAGSECIGDSLSKINSNFTVLGNASCLVLSAIRTLSAVPFTPGYSGTVELRLDNGNLLANIKPQSINFTHLNFNDTGPFSFRNKVINGDMLINQRWGTSLVTIDSSVPVYTLDRWYAYATTGSMGTFTVCQSSIVADNHYTPALKATVKDQEFSLGVTKSWGLAQKIEGFNIAEFNWGTEYADTVLLSFWVKTNALSSNFGGSISNGSNTRSYPFTYKAVSTDWEQIKIVIFGDQAGSWPLDNNAGLIINFSLGEGLLKKAEANGTWYNGNYKGATDQYNLITAEPGKFLCITGVHLERGSEQTIPESPPFDVVLQSCKRYYEKSYLYEHPPGTATTDNAYFAEPLVITSNSQNSFFAPFTVEKRGSLTSVAIYSTSGAMNKFRDITNAVDKPAYPSSTSAGKNSKMAMFDPENPTVNLQSGINCLFHWVAESEL